MTKMYYVCNRVDKEEMQCSTLLAAQVAWKIKVDDMVNRVLWVFRTIDKNYAEKHVASLFYVKQVEYVRAEVIYSASDLKELKDE